MTTCKLVPPDGGYGWAIVAAYALHHLIVLPIGQGFGLIFKDKFKELEFSATDISLIMNTNAACSAWFGLINGVLLRKLGYRKVATIGALLMTSGIFMMAFANTFTQFMIIYGIITAIGMGMGLSSYPLAMNTYFTKNRSKAVGYGITINGLGPVLMPQLMSFLLGVYGVKGAVMILSGTVAHTFATAFLLQPVKRHMKKEFAEDDLDKVESQKLLDKGGRETDEQIPELSLEEEVKVESAYSIDSHLSGSVLSLYHASRDRSLSVSSRQSELKLSALPKPASVTEEELEEETHEKNNINCKNKSEELDKGNLNTQDGTQKTTSLLNSCGNYIVDLFDLTLLKDLTFVNIIIGVAMGVFAEKNFAMLIPFIMQEYHLSTQEIATFMSMLSIADIFFRFITPYISNMFDKPVRVMYLWALVFLILFRLCLLATSSYIVLLVCAVLIGFARGFRTIYWILVVPTHVPIDRLASASGLQSIATGALVWIGAPFLDKLLMPPGIVKDLTGSYKMCILVINFMMFLNIIFWTTELTYKHCKSKHKVKNVKCAKR